MQTTKFLAAAAFAATAIASPAMAQDVVRQPVVNSGYTYNNGYYDNGYGYRDRGFWPGDVAAGVVGDAIGTAGAIATAPFRALDNSYAYDSNYNTNNRAYRESYAQRNGFVCQPGTLFRGEDGRKHICQ
jgi:hypothetical protein